MSVVSKMTVGAVKPFPNGHQINLNCVYAQALSGEDAEDVRFSKATPYGQAQFNDGAENAEPRVRPNQNVYLLLDRVENSDPTPDFDHVLYAAFVRCHCITDFGHDRSADFSPSYGFPEGHPDNRLPPAVRMNPANGNNMTMKQSISNRAASVQFEPDHNFLVRIYDADSMALEEVLTIARLGSL